MHKVIRYIPFRYTCKHLCYKMLLQYSAKNVFVRNLQQQLFRVIQKLKKFNFRDIQRITLHHGS